MQPIGIVHSPFREKFGVPRQAGLAPAAHGRVELYPPFDDDACVAGLEGFSHLWLLVVFHECEAHGWRASVRPPRLGGNAKVGVFASRSPFRPNPIGLSAVALEGISREAGRLCLQVSGVDLVNATPVLDIKPYLAYADSLPGARCAFADAPPAPKLTVRFTQEALEGIASRREQHPQLALLIEQVLRMDPRPAYMQRDEAAPIRHYGMRLLDFDLRWCVEGDEIVVQALVSA